jgi:hypothetical protein
VRLVVAPHVFSVSSGVIPGAGEDGHDASALICGGGGPDRVFHLLLKVLFVKARGLVVILVSLMSPAVTYSHRCG